MCVELAIMVSYIPMDVNQFCLDTVMLTGLGVLMTGKVLLEDASSWETILFLGLARSKIVCPCPLLKLNTLLLDRAALSSLDEANSQGLCHQHDEGASLL